MGWRFLNEPSFTSYKYDSFEEYYIELEKVFARGFELLDIKDRNLRIVEIGCINIFIQVFYGWAKTGFKNDIDDLGNNVVNLMLFGPLTKSREYPIL